MLIGPCRFCNSPLSSSRTAHRSGNVTKKLPPGGQRARCDACASGRTLRRQSGSSWRSSTMKLSQTATEPPVPLHPAQLQPKTQPDRGRFKACAASEAHRAIVSRPSSRASTPYKPTRARTRNRLRSANAASFTGVSKVLRGVHIVVRIQHRIFRPAKWGRYHVFKLNPIKWCKNILN